jgi:hypothetical protein
MKRLADSEDGTVTPITIISRHRIGAGDSLQ